MENHVQLVGQDHGEDLLVAPERDTILFFSWIGHVFNMSVPEEIEGFFLGKPSHTMRKHEDAGYVVVDTADDRTTKTG